MKALVGAEAGGYRLASDLPVPTPRPGEILCRVHAVALNPLDAKVIDYSQVPGALGGCDFAGTVVAAGAGVTRFRAGDRVLAVTFPMDAADKAAGAFAEYALATEGLACHIPDALPFTDATAMGLAIATAGLALFQLPGLALPFNAAPGTATGEVVLVSGGATATGTMATQLLRIAGYTPIVTCSPSNDALCASFGAAATFDYHSASCGADIRVHTDNGLRHVLDCVTDAASMKTSYEAIGAGGGAYVALEAPTAAVKYTRRDVRADWLMAPSLLGVPVHKKGAYGRPSTPAHKQFGTQLFAQAEAWLRDGAIRHHPVEIREGGLAGITDGVDDMRLGKVHAKKLVLPLLG
ncbi:alcohol dehydrogenase GroES-like domain-containing protein [Lasiosphaeria ovina]|uniref:Alcohol dehydrogenase GroES-like domain-containing protein n=1 Tax=Lasiosphaeria ovina TaxID=92902 RepID=A0AAE0JTJ7_9PEZI|nr:alcohol dehydrogenase GroES-like domain-containing protein [Lasiosphaeria ovina]